ncbi:hypothetical protein RFI_37624 [Reticulomyxa filosa]|uniref:U-box domain-containing protein n=1 Tax=Reticulomyxa filosa TaxID=46433 RepID=X6LCV4_RETFI|nr:hypothetical protein RFI_37624 [Reticulomyxa filosa]|eukprot:ETN99842.1 hypothetical protein RFI_37624 [Reticulomyxa filosa]
MQGGNEKQPDREEVLQKEIAALREEIEKLKRETRYVLPKETTMPDATSMELEQCARNEHCPEIEESMVEIKDKMKEWQTLMVMPDFTELKSEDIWANDGTFQVWKRQQLQQMEDMSSMVISVLQCQQKLSEEREKKATELKKRKQEYVQVECMCETQLQTKEQLKAQVEICFRQCVDAIQKWNDFVTKKIQTKKEVRLLQHALDMRQTLDMQCEEHFNKLKEWNELMEQQIYKKDEWIADMYEQLQKTWYKWTPQEITVFMAQTLKCEKAEMSKLHGLLCKHNINGQSLLSISKKEFIDIFQIQSFAKASLIFDNIHKIAAKYPIPNGQQQKREPDPTIPTEFLCPLSKTIMNDPVIALDQITYDRLSLQNFCRDKTNPLSPCNGKPLTKNGELLLYSNHSLRRRIQQCAKVIFFWFCKNLEHNTIHIKVIFFEKSVSHFKLHSIQKE